MFQLDFKKAKESEIKLKYLLDHQKARKFQKNICFIDYVKVFDCVDHNKLWKFLKRWEYQITFPASYGIPLQYSCLESPMDRGAW